MTRDDVTKLLKRECAKAGSQKAWAVRVGISLPHVNDVLHGRREPGVSVCRALGIERVTTYRRVRAGEAT